jgi:hypothetical protein
MGKGRIKESTGKGEFKSEIFHILWELLWMS